MSTIKRFRAGWLTARNEGRIQLRDANKETIELPFTDPMEFMAVLTVLTSAHQVEFRNGVVWSGPELIDGD